MSDLTVKPHFKVMVGCPDKNYVSFEIAATKDMKKLGASIAIPCGKATSQKKYLCADGKRARLTPRSEPADKLKFLAQQATEKIVSWKSNTFSLNAGEKVTIIISGFNPERDGNASLHLKIGNPNPLHDEPYTGSIEQAPGVAIIYFDVSPTNVLQDGQVTISSTTTGAKTVKLYAGESVVEPATAVTDQTVTVKRYTHKPQSDLTYRLKAWQEKEGGDDEADARAGKFVQRELAVAVVPRPGWYSWDLLNNSLAGANAGQNFYPTLLLAAKDLSGETDGDILYGIFVCKETKEAGLWSSSSGFDDWSFLGKVPEGMGDCPGVIHNKALWLIGGSSADPEGPVSNRVCWYYKSKDEMVWKEWDEDGSLRKDSARAPAPRKCHACAVFDDKVWVLGGLSRQNLELADVWTCSADPTSENFTAIWKQSKPLPSGRCMLAVAATPKHTKIAGLKKPRLWLYGGATHPYNYKNPFDKLLWTEKGEVWVDSQDPFGVKLPGKEGEPMGATLLYASDQRLHLLGQFRKSGGGRSMSVHDLQDLTSKDTDWDNAPLVDIGWDFSMTELFLIRSVSFRERWIFWPIFQKMAEKEKCRARIYNAR